MLDGVPARCMPIIAMNANAHLDLQQANGTWLPPLSKSVGPMARDRENQAGTAFRTFLERNKLIAISHGERTSASRPRPRPGLVIC